jgi:hypothetical protein
MTTMLKLQIQETPLATTLKRYGVTALMFALTLAHAVGVYRHVNGLVDASWIILLLMLTMPFVWNRRLARLQARYHVGDDLNGWYMGWSVAFYMPVIVLLQIVRQMR